MTLSGPELIRGVRVGPIRDGWRVRVPDNLAPYVGFGRPYQGTFSLNFPHHIAPGKPCPLPGEEIIPVLVRLNKLVEGIVDSFSHIRSRKEFTLMPTG